jgi:RecA-family ATPase
MQMVALWAVGKAAFGIKPTKPLSILTIQAEDDKNDLIAMSRSVVRGLNFTEAEKELGARNNRILTIHTYTGENFVSKLNGWLERHHAETCEGTSDLEPIDLIIINPVFSYIGAGEVNDTLPVRELLRWGLFPLAVKHRVGVLMVHHTPKANNRDTSKYRAHDYMYSGHGSAEFTNAARAVITIEQTQDAGVFQFIAAKRGSYIGWEKNKDGIYTRFYKHSTDGSLLWKEAGADDVAAATKPNECRAEDVVRALRGSPTLLIQKEIEEGLKADGLGNIKDTLPKLLRDMAAAERIFLHPRRCEKRQPLEAFALFKCEEDIPSQILELVPAEGIGKVELTETAQVRLKLSSAEAKEIITKLKVEGQLREESGDKNKKFFFRA